MRCQCLKYIHIYIFIQQEREIWRGERCGALAVLGRERACARHMHKPARQRPPQNPGCPDRLGLRRLCIHTCDILKGYRYTQLAYRHTHVLRVVPFIKFSPSERKKVHTCDISAEEMVRAYGHTQMAYRHANVERLETHTCRKAWLETAVFHVLGEVLLPAQLPSRRPHFHSSFVSARRIFHCLLWFEFGCFPRPGRGFHCSGQFGFGCFPRPGRGFTACPAAQPPTPLSFLFLEQNRQHGKLALAVTGLSHVPILTHP